MTLRHPFALLLVACLVLAAVPRGASARQVQWTDRSDQIALLPASIRVFEGEDATAGLKAWLVEATPDPERWVSDVLLSSDADGMETVSEFAARTGSFVALNGGYFDGSVSYSFVAREGGVMSQNVGSLVRDGTTYYPTRGAFGERSDGMFEATWIYDVGGTTWGYPAPNPNAQGMPAAQPSGTWPEGGTPWPVVTGIGGGPMLVVDGEVAISYDEEVMFGSGVSLDTRRPRTVIGVKADGTLLIVVFEGDDPTWAGATLPEAAATLVSLGADRALNLDGGGSSTLVVGTTPLRPTTVGAQRQVASAVVLRRPDETGGGGP